jgi:hypothetical protein
MALDKTLYELLKTILLSSFTLRRKLYEICGFEGTEKIFVPKIYYLSADFAIV